jgi:hypothetical protein
MMLLHRRGLIRILAPAIIAAPHLMRLSRKSSKLLLRDDPLLAPYKGLVRYDLAAYYAPYVPSLIERRSSL